MLRKTCVLVPLLVLSLAAVAQDSRHFTFHYAFTVKNLPTGKKVRVWIPAAHSDAYQEVKIVSAKGDLPLKTTSESKYGNEIYFAEARSAAQSELHFDVEYDVVRHERVALHPAAHVVAASLTSKERQKICNRTRWSQSRACPPNWRSRLPKARGSPWTRRAPSTTTSSPP